MATPRQRKAAEQAGSAAGLVAGAALGYKGVKGANRLRRGASEGRKAYKFFRQNSSTRREAAGAARRIGSTVTRRSPRARPTLGSVGGGYLGAVGGSLGGSAAGVKLADAHTRKTQMAKREKPLMSDAEQRRRQKLQGKIGRTTSTLGLAGVGLAGTGAVLVHKPGALAKIPKLTKDPEKLKSAAFHTGIISGGIGGVGGFNQASIYSAESRRRKQPVTKGLTMDMGCYGEEGTPLALEEIEKAWEPLASKFDAESRRHQRNQNAEVGLAGASAGAGAAAGAVGGTALRQLSANKKINPRAKNLPNVRAGMAARKLKAVKSGKVAAGLAGGSAALAGGAALVHRQRKGPWQSYGKRDALSAFGVDHSDEVSKVNVKPLMGSLAPRGALEHMGHVGAGGQTTSRALAGGMPNHGPRNALLARGQAKAQGQRAAKQLAQGGKTQATESANLGWRSKAVAHRGLSQPAGNAPAGMRGPIGSRVQTSAMKRRNSAFN